MPLTLTTPLTSVVTAYRIDEIHIDVESNKITTLLAMMNEDNQEVGHKEWICRIFDDFGTIIIPRNWPAENPTGPQLYALIENFIFLGLQDLPGENGLGPGEIT